MKNSKGTYWQRLPAEVQKWGIKQFCIWLVVSILIFAFTVSADILYLGYILIFIYLFVVFVAIDKKGKNYKATDEPQVNRVSYPAAESGNCRVCPKCGGRMQISAVEVGKKSGLGTILLYILLTITIFGIFIIIVLSLRKKTKTQSIAVCQTCGYRKKISPAVQW